MKLLHCTCHMDKMLFFNSLHYSSFLGLIINNLSSADLFKINVYKKSFKNTI